MQPVKKIRLYDMLKKLHCQWLSDMEQCVRKSIAEYDKFIVAEAGDDKCIDFAKEAFLYKRFQDNNKYGMVWCNIEVLKYFVLFIERKILYHMIGEWKFTDMDYVMSEYFRRNEFKSNHYDVNKIIKYTNREPTFIGDTRESKEWKLTIDTADTEPIQVNYIDFFLDKFIACNDMVRNVKSLDLYGTEINLFDKTSCLYEHSDIIITPDNVIKF